MKLLFGTRSLFNAAWILIALLSGPTVVASVWLLAAIAAEAGFVVLPDTAPRFSGPKGREADVTELVATREQTGGALGLFRQTIASKSGPPTHIHQTEDEFFYVVKGEFKLKLGDRLVSAPAQSGRLALVQINLGRAFIIACTNVGFQGQSGHRDDVLQCFRLIARHPSSFDRFGHLAGLTLLPAHLSGTPKNATRKCR